jgi:hypothetical protein
MKITDYIDAERFPLTTQKGLAPKDQMFLDAFNHDQVKEAVENGYVVTNEDKARWAELEEKIKHHAALQAELRKDP